MKRLLVVGLMLVLVLQLTACGSSESTGGSDAQLQRETTEEIAPPENADPSDWKMLKRIAGRYSNRLLIPRGPAPEQEVIRDLRVGKGPALKQGDYFKATYVSFTYRDGKAVERLWHSPAIYILGDQVKAWNVGLEGIRIGGIRELIAPSRLAYGDGARVYLVHVLSLA